MSKLQVFLKHHFPSFYIKIRNILFPLVENLRLKKRQQFNHPVDKVVSTLGQNFTIALDPSNGFIDAHIYATGTYEPDILQVMKDYLRPGDTFVDIGGNIGWHSLFATSLVGEQGKVHTFEPLPKLNEQFKRSIKLNNFSKQVTLHSYGCSDVSGKAYLHINEKNIGGSSILDERYSETVEISTLPADEILRDLSEISLIKIDTEGFEIEVLRGLKTTLSQLKPKLIIEFSPSFWTNQKIERSKEFFAILTFHDYSILDLENGYKPIVNTDGWINEFNKLQTNLLCLPK